MDYASDMEVPMGEVASSPLEVASSPMSVGPDGECCNDPPTPPARSNLLDSDSEEQEEEGHEDPPVGQGVASLSMAGTADGGEESEGSARWGCSRCRWRATGCNAKRCRPKPGAREEKDRKKAEAEIRKKSKKKRKPSKKEKAVLPSEPELGSDLPPDDKEMAVMTSTMSTTSTTTSTTTASSASTAPQRGKLAEEFIVPPFSVLDAKAGYWQSRKREWLDTGLDGGAGRAENLLGDAGLRALMPGLSGTSIFDPVLCELMYKWYAPKPGGQGAPPVVVVDPFAGGATRGIVAARRGLLYVGTDVSARQVEANKEQAGRLCANCAWAPHWVVSCGERLPEALAGVCASLGLPTDTRADCLLTCPPYYNLEKYGGGDDDLSMLPSYKAFRAKYATILRAATGLLKPQHVAITVVGNLRNPRSGKLHDLHSDTKRLLAKAGNVLYNDLVLLNALASAAMRAPRQMRAASKNVLVHQNVIVTCRDEPLDAAACRRIGICAGDPA